MTGSFLRISRRLRSYGSFLLGILLASLLPMTLVLALFHDHLMDDARELLDHRAQRSHQEISRLLADAENQLENQAWVRTAGWPPTSSRGPG